VASEYSKVAELTAKLETKKEEFGVFMSRVLSLLEKPDAASGSEPSLRVVKTLQVNFQAPRYTSRFLAVAIVGLNCFSQDVQRAMFCVPFFMIFLEP
jgi:hypothetical protein